MQNFFFFTVSDGKFLRIDLDKVTRVITIDDKVCLDTSSGSYSLSMSVSQIKQLLPADKFVWPSESAAVPFSSSSNSH